MSFADYVHGMTIKYRLAVAIAVLKGKPNDLSIEQYIEKLRAKYENSAMETDETNISICSDDFLLNDDDLEVINGGFNDSYNDDDMVEINLCARNNSLTEVLQTLKDIDNIAEKENNAILPLTPTQNIFIDDSQLLENPTNNLSKNCNEITKLTCTELLIGFSIENTDKNNNDREIFNINNNIQEKLNFNTKTANNINQIIDIEDTNKCDQLETGIDTGINYQANEVNIQNIDIDQTSDHNQLCDSQMIVMDNVRVSRNIYDRNRKEYNSEKFSSHKIQENHTHMTNIHSKRGDNNDGKRNYNETYDSQLTEMYSFSQNFTHVSQSQFEVIDIPRKYICGKRNDETNEKINGVDENYTIFDERKIENGNKPKDINSDSKNIIDDVCSTITVDNNLGNDKDAQDINMHEEYVDTLRRNDSLLGMHTQYPDSMLMAPHSLNHTQRQSKDANSFETNREEANERYSGISTAHSTSQHLNSDTMLMVPQVKQNTHYQDENANYVGRNAEYDGRNTDTMLMVPQDIQDTQIQEENANSLNTIELIKRVNETLVANNVDSSQIQYIIDKDGKMYRMIHMPSQSQQYNIINNKEIVKHNDTYTQLNKDKHIEEITKQHTEKLDKVPPKTQRTEMDIVNGQKTSIKDTSTQKTFRDDTVQKTNKDASTVVNMDTIVKHAKETENLSQNDDYPLDFEDLTDSQIEVIPFKVLEELNRIKNYLNRGERRNIDGSQTDSSGYKSDSQMSIRNASQTQNTWLNQSAYCLYNYLLDCQLISTTQEITAEVSQVLANLVDRLHEEEHYPPFLSAILETIDKIIHDICQGNSFGEDVLAQKDENIQRLCLLNKTVHILKYTIEKVTEKLEDMHKNLTDNEKLYELTDIDICENICYIFHVLEILLKRYLKVKDVLSQSTQNSQVENILKKSSIVDIWRKKWIPNYKEKVSTDDCMEKQCVLTKCREILNKMIVGCMEGYSLVSFAALQCFNLLQNQ